jgi:pimeloyl-ACP methyl ester carboxylesterase
VRGHYRMIRYRRRGYAASSPIDGAVLVAEHAQDCRALLGALDVKQAHVVGHSYGTSVALQLAVGAPGIVYSGVCGAAAYHDNAAVPRRGPRDRCSGAWLCGSMVNAQETLRSGAAVFNPGG